jgi:hypothetical protein
MDTDKNEDGRLRIEDGTNTGTPRFAASFWLDNWIDGSMDTRETATRLASPAASWSAPAERSGDGAFVRTKRKQTNDRLRPRESGAEATALQTLRVHEAADKLERRSPTRLVSMRSPSRRVGDRRSGITDFLQNFDPGLTTRGRRN